MSAKTGAALGGPIDAEQLATILGLTTARIRQLTKEGYVVRLGHGTYDAGQSIRGYIRYWKERAEAKRDAPAEGSLEAARLLKAQAEAATAQLDLQDRRAEMLSLDFVAMEFEARLGPVAAKLRNLPSYAPQLSDKSVDEIARMLEDLCEQIMQDLRVLADGSIDPTVSREPGEDERDEGDDGT